MLFFPFSLPPPPPTRTHIHTHTLFHSPSFSLADGLLFFIFTPPSPFFFFLTISLRLLKLSFYLSLVPTPSRPLSLPLLSFFLSVFLSFLWPHLFLCCALPPPVPLFLLFAAFSSSLALPHLFSLSLSLSLSFYFSPIHPLPFPFLSIPLCLSPPPSSSYSLSLSLSHVCLTPSLSFQTAFLSFVTHFFCAHWLSDIARASCSLIIWDAQINRPVELLQGNISAYLTHCLSDTERHLQCAGD